MAFNAAEGPVSKFIGNHLVRDPQLTWKELEELLVEEYANEETAIEAMRSLMKLVQIRGKTLGKLGVRAKKMPTLAFPGEVRDNTAIQAQLVDLYIEALQNEYIRHDVIKEALVKLSVAIALAKYNQRIWQR